MAMPPLTRVGFQFASYDVPDVPDYRLFDHVVRMTQTAEACGFDSIWVMDHLHQIDTVGDPSEPMLEAYTTLSALAQATTTVRLGALVSPVGFRAPALLAKMVTNLDVISKGRAILGIGAGWHEEEFKAYGLDFPPLGERMRELREAVRICRGMFRGRHLDFDGAYFKVDGALNVPRPSSPGGPPILIGGSGERTTIPMVARYADACNFFGGPATVRRKIEVLNRSCDAIERSPTTITKTWLGTALIADSERELHEGIDRLARLHGINPAAVPGMALCGTPVQVAERVRAYRDAGVDGIIVNMDDAYDLERLARAGAILSEAMK